MSLEPRMQEIVLAQALEWFVAHRSSELTDARREDFIDWLRASPAHVREYLALTGFAEDLKALAGEFPASAETLIERARAEPESVHPIFATTELASDSRRSALPAAARPRLRSWAIAASVAITAIAMAVLGAWRWSDQGDYSTAHAEQRSWRMPDGSTVHLNSGSKIRLRFDDHRREVDLIQGQALFQVAKDARRPFWVRAGAATIKAVGTEFDVYRQPQRTVISVVEGRVAVWGPLESVSETAKPPAPVTQLEAGQQARIGHTSAEVSKRAEDVRKTVAWLQRQVVFDHDPLASAAAEFNRYSETSIRIDDESLRSSEVSGIFSAYDTEAFIRFLEHQPDMHVERRDRDVIITPNTPTILSR